MNGFNTLFGSHFDKYVIVYKKFSPMKPDPEIFNVEGILSKVLLKYIFIVNII